MRYLLAVLVAVTALAQTPQSPIYTGGGGGGAAAIACVGTPGNTTGSYRQQCQTGAGAVYACNNAAGCTVAGDWVAVAGSGSFTALSGDATSTATGGATSVVKVNGGAIPASKTIVGTNSSNQIVDASAATLANNTSGNAATATALAAQAADTVVLNATGGSASPTAVAMPSSGTNGCAGASNALTYNTSTHALGCNSISGGGGTWGSITGTLSSQTDLQTALNAKTPLNSTPLNGPGLAAKCQGGIAGAGFSVPASSAQPSTDAPPQAACEADGLHGYLAFTLSVEQIIADEFYIPASNWTGNLSVTLDGGSSSTSAPTITIALLCISTAATTGGTYGTTQTISFTPGATSGRTTLNTSLTTDATHATKACAAGDLVQWKLDVIANAAANLNLKAVRFFQ